MMFNHFAIDEFLVEAISEGRILSLDELFYECSGSLVWSYGEFERTIEIEHFPDFFMNIVGALVTATETEGGEAEIFSLDGYTYFSIKIEGNIAKVFEKMEFKYAIDKYLFLVEAVNGIKNSCKVILEEMKEFEVVSQYLAPFLSSIECTQELFSGDFKSDLALMRTTFGWED